MCVCVLFCMSACVRVLSAFCREQLLLRPATYGHLVSSMTSIRCACSIRCFCFACSGSWWGGPEPLIKNMVGELLPRKFSSQCALCSGTPGALGICTHTCLHNTQWSQQCVEAWFVQLSSLYSLWTMFRYLFSSCMYRILRCKTAFKSFELPSPLVVIIVGN